MKMPEQRDALMDIALNNDPYLIFARWAGFEEPLTLETAKQELFIFIKTSVEQHRGQVGFVALDTNLKDAKRAAACLQDLLERHLGDNYYPIIQDGNWLGAKQYVRDRIEREREVQASFQGHSPLPNTPRFLCFNFTNDQWDQVDRFVNQMLRIIPDRTEPYHPT